LSRKAIERETRQRYVLAAARKLLAGRGIENTTMEDIAQAVEYTRRTLYAYFPSRDEIYLQVFIDDLSSRWAAQQEALAEVAAESGLARILVWGESFYAYSRANPLSLQMHLYFDFKGIDRNRITRKTFNRFRTLNTELAEGLREIFQQGVKDGSLQPDLDMDLCISQYIYSLRAIVNRAVSPGYSFARFAPDEYVRHYLDLFSRSIRSLGGTRK
jgi:AcrR family transcriptional regulator